MMRFQISRPISWRLPWGEDTREAVFLVTADAEGPIAVSLVRVQGLACSYSPAEARLFEQPVAEWEAAAEASLQAVPNA